MRYMLLERASQEALLGELERTPAFVRAAFAGLGPAEAATGAPDGSFAPVEQAWHLADLEREGFAVRIERLLREDTPLLPDFDGARRARERDYKTRSLAVGLALFERARAQAVAALHAVPPADWTRHGIQEGVGRVALCDLPAMMAEHDAAHRAEIEAWLASRRGASS